MNNTGSAIRIAYDLAMNPVIKDTSDLLLDGIKDILLKEMGFAREDLLIQYEPPVSFATQLDPTKILTINEQRKMLDEDFPMLEEGNMFLTDREQIIVTRDDDQDGIGDSESELQVTEVESHNEE